MVRTLRAELGTSSAVDQKMRPIWAVCSASQRGQPEAVRGAPTGVFASWVRARRGVAGQLSVIEARMRARTALVHQTGHTKRLALRPSYARSRGNSKAPTTFPLVEAVTHRVGVTGFEPAASSSRTGDHSAL